MVDFFKEKRRVKGFPKTVFEENRSKVTCDVHECWSIIHEDSVKCGDTLSLELSKKRGVKRVEKDAFENSVKTSIGEKSIAQIGATVKSVISSEVCWEEIVEKKRVVGITSPRCGKRKVEQYQKQRIYSFTITKNNYFSDDIKIEKTFTEYIESYYDNAAPSIMDEPSCNCGTKFFDYFFHKAILDFGCIKTIASYKKNSNKERTSIVLLMNGKINRLDYISDSHFSFSVSSDFIPDDIKFLGGISNELHEVIILPYIRSNDIRSDSVAKDITVEPEVKYRADYMPSDFIITNIDLVIELRDSATRVIAVSKFERKVKEITSLDLDGDNLTLVRIEINGKSWTDYQEGKGKLTLYGLPVSFEMLIETEITPETNTSLKGLYKSEGTYCTQCEAEGFRRITYYLDRPDVLALFTTTIIADKEQFPYLLSNGNRVDSGTLHNGRHWARWQDPFPKPSYLFSMVAGDFDVLRDKYTTVSGRDVALEIFVDKGNLYRAYYAMTSLIKSMNWDEKRFGLEYDLDIYMIVAVDFFDMGAMENKGLNIFNSKYVLANPNTATDADYQGIQAIIGHEYFHNWTGNRVTCRDWFQLSLKEGLAVFRDQEFLSDLGSRAVNRINNVRIMRGPQFSEDRGPMSHPIRPEKVVEMNNFYTLTIYEKGSEVIRMMHTLLGEVYFQAGLKLYLKRHDGTAATCDDFVQAMEDASGISLEKFRRWYSQSGTPVVHVETEYLDQENRYRVMVRQHTGPTPGQEEKHPLHIPFDIELYDSRGNVIPLQCNGENIHHVLDVTEAEQKFVFDGVEEKPVISMLREFSAPVILEYDYTDEELAFLMIHARNEFARWDAGQILLAKQIKLNVTRCQSGESFAIPDAVVDAFRCVLLDEKLDPAFIAEMLTLPSENEVAGWYNAVDVDAINSVMAELEKALAADMEDEFSAIYHSLTQAAYTIEHEAMAKRSLRNTCLSYLAHTGQGNSLAAKQYQVSDNMTDTMAAMTAANNAELACRAELMADFSNNWTHDSLVMDKWLMLQGKNPAANALDKVRETMNHNAFDIKNPNRTCSLVASFCADNPVRFHAKDGSGYQFLTEVLTILNSSNPQVASRLIEPFLNFRQYDERRQELMRAELEKLSQLDNLAKDLFEKVQKASE